MFSPRGVFVFLAFFLPGVMYVFYERFADAGMVAAIDEFQANHSEDGESYFPIVSVLCACVPFFLIGFVAALVHDVAFGMGKFLPKHKREEFPHLASLWDQRKRAPGSALPKAPAPVRRARVKYALLSLFAPLFTILPCVIPVVALSPDEPNKFAVIAALVLGLGIGIALRLHYAGLYVATKERAPAFRFLALMGIWGWLILFQIEDRSNLSGFEQDPREYF